MDANSSHRKGGVGDGEGQVDRKPTGYGSQDEKPEKPRVLKNTLVWCVNKALCPHQPDLHQVPSIRTGRAVTA